MRLLAPNSLVLAALLKQEKNDAKIWYILSYQNLLLYSVLYVILLHRQQELITMAYEALKKKIKDMEAKRKAEYPETGDASNSKETDKEASAYRKAFERAKTKEKTGRLATNIASMAIEQSLGR